MTVRAQGDGIEMSAEASPKQKTIVEFSLPGRLRFDASGLKQVVFPTDGNQSVGVAFLRGFFQPQAVPTRWDSHLVGGQGYSSLYGDGLVMRDVEDPPVPLHATDEGRKWLGTAVAGSVAKAKATVNRAPKKEQAELVLVDSEHGAYFSATSLGGRGRLWRLGGAIRDREEELATTLLCAAIERLAADHPNGRDTIGLIALSNGPPAGSWSSVPMQQWQKSIQRVHAAQSGKVKFVELQDAEAVAKAQASGTFLAILNPYGEWLPVAKQGGMAAAVQAIGRYVREGGNWFETGGHPFFVELYPADRFYRFSVDYPAAFADFVHLEFRSASAAVYRVQPRAWEPWQAARDAKCIFVPGRLACGGDASGGWCDRSFITYVAAGKRWTSPGRAIGGRTLGPRRSRRVLPG